MTINVDFVLYVLAAATFVAAALRVPEGRVGFVALGLFLLVLSLII